MFGLISAKKLEKDMREIYARENGEMMREYMKEHTDTRMFHEGYKQGASSVATFVLKHYCKNKKINEQNTKYYFLGED